MHDFSILARKIRRNARRYFYIRFSIDWPGGTSRENSDQTNQLGILISHFYRFSLLIRSATIVRPARITSQTSLRASSVQFTHGRIARVASESSGGSRYPPVAHLKRTCLQAISNDNETYPVQAICLVSPRDVK